METARAKLQSDVSALDEEMPGRITEYDFEFPFFIHFLYISSRLIH